jgi:hypothetical protein
MNSYANVERQNGTGALARQGGLLQRKCECGTHTPGGGQCDACAKKQRGLQRKLSVGASNDPLELEADRVANQVLAEPGPGSVSAAPPRIQRAPAAEAESGDEGSEAPDSVQQTLGEGGRPLDSGVRQDMEQRFHQDFSQVRVHTGQHAAQSADEVGAQAYTVGRNVVFGERQYAPASPAGRQLLAHELTHVVQQGGGSPVLRAKPGGTKKAAPKKPAIPQICGRDSMKVKDNEITKVTVDLGSNKLTITWKDATKAPPGSTDPQDISPGAGLCCKDCDDDTTSQTTGSLCTPKGTWKVDRIGCVLSPKHPGAKNATFFQRPGVAIHTGNTNAPPKSHGCTRTALKVAALIHDNVVVDNTDIVVTGTWAGTTCYKKEADELPVPRSSVCDGFNLKPPPTPKTKAKGKAKSRVDAPATVPSDKPKAKAPQPVADAEGAQDDLVATRGDDSMEEQGMIPDGPGPNNSPAALGEVDVPLDMIAEDGGAGDDTPAAADATKDAAA